MAGLGMTLIDLSGRYTAEMMPGAGTGRHDSPDYRMLGRLADIFPGVPRLAVTATADARTREDIRAELRLANAAEFVASFARSATTSNPTPTHHSRHRRCTSRHRAHSTGHP